MTAPMIPNDRPTAPKGGVGQSKKRGDRPLRLKPQGEVTVTVKQSGEQVVAVGSGWRVSYELQRVEYTNTITLYGEGEGGGRNIRIIFIARSPSLTARRVRSNSWRSIAAIPTRKRLNWR